MYFRGNKRTRSKCSILTMHVTQGRSKERGQVNSNRRGQVEDVALRSRSECVVSVKQGKLLTGTNTVWLWRSCYYNCDTKNVREHDKEKNLTPTTQPAAAANKSVVSFHLLQRDPYVNPPLLYWHQTHIQRSFRFFLFSLIIHLFSSLCFSLSILRWPWLSLHLSFLLSLTPSTPSRASSSLSLLITSKHRISCNHKPVQLLSVTHLRQDHFHAKPRIQLDLNILFHQAAWILHLLSSHPAVPAAPLRLHLFHAALQKVSR